MEDKRPKRIKPQNTEPNQKTKKRKKNKEAVNNSKHRNNKVLKAKEILAKNKEALAKESERVEEAAKRSLPIRILLTLKKVIFGILIILLAAALISFIAVRISGGTPQIFGYSVHRIVSGSMEPALRIGDIILSKGVSSPSDIAVDDIVTFDGGPEFDNKLITHRVIVQPTPNIDGEIFLTTKGDSNELPDNEIPFSAVKSKFIRKIEFLNKFYEFFMSPWGLIVFIAALLIIFFDELLTVVRVITGNYNEDEDEDESVGEIMNRLKLEEQERLRAEQEQPAGSKKRNNTSVKKMKHRAKRGKSDRKKSSSSKSGKANKKKK